MNYKDILKLVIALYLLPSSHCQLKNTTVCEANNLQIACYFGKVIRTRRALYGRTKGESTCLSGLQKWFLFGARPACGHWGNSLSVVQNYCDGKSECTLPVSPKYFRDHCIGLSKYLYLEYECSSSKEVPGDCNGGVRRLYNNPGTIVSHSLFNSKSYSNNLECSWELVASPKAQVKLEFTKFELESEIEFPLQPCPYDRVEITTGINAKNSTVSYCGKRDRFVVHSESNRMRIKFITDNRIQKSGFSATYTFIRRYNLALAPFCGISAVPPIEESPIIQSKIVGGRTAVPHSWPWMGLLEDTRVGSSNFCGITMISADWLATAAHCIVPLSKQLDKMKITLGKHAFADGDNNKNSMQNRKVKQVIVHDRYNPALMSHDFGLIQVTPPFRFTKEVSPICLPTAAKVNAGTPCYITGWGTTRGNPVYVSPFPLQQAMVPIIDWALCNKWYQNSLSSLHMCAGYKHGGKDTCQGDSGGPLQCKLNNRYELRGVTSFGSGCANAASPGVYTNINEMVSWIEDTLLKEGFGKMRTTI